MDYEISRRTRPEPVEMEYGRKRKKLNHLIEEKMKNLKKKIAGMAVALTLAIVATIGVNLNKQNPTAGLLLENVEAFANGGEITIKFETCIGSKTPCILSNGGKGEGAPVFVETEF